MERAKGEAISEATGKASLSGVRTKRFLITDGQGWTTIVRKPVLKPSREQAPTRFSRLTQLTNPPSKLSSLFSRPAPSSLFKLTHGLQPGNLVTSPSGFADHSFKSTNKTSSTTPFPPLYKPAPRPGFSQLPQRHFSFSNPSFKSILLSFPSMASHSDKGKAIMLPKNSAGSKTGKNSSQASSSRVGWKGKCYRCLDIGHDRSTCKAKAPKCAKCHEEGHETRKCQAGKPAFDPLEPRGNLGEDLLPTNRPDAIWSYVPQTKDSYRDMRFLQRAVVVDARLWPGHDASGVQAKVMATCKVDEPFELSPCLRTNIY